jgi:indolepyruvate decarboxylase
MKRATTIGEYLIHRLHAHGVRHVFGIPGDYALSFNELLTRSPLRFINTCDEQGAGFAADAYARVHGLGAVCVTYCVGGLKIANTTAEAYAEKSPVVVISGAPGMRERERNPLLHHKVKEFDTQLKVFQQLTAASTVLGDAQTAFEEIDRVLEAALRYKRPVYLELPRDMVHVPGQSGPRRPSRPETSHRPALRAALAEAMARLNAARRPVILADVEVHRFGLHDELLRLARRSGLPVAATMMGKSVIGEQHPFYLGIYGGAMGREEVRRQVEGSDCLLMLGAFMTDINLGIFTARLDPARCISVTSEKLSIGHHSYEGVLFPDFVRGLARARWRRRPAVRVQRPRPPRGAGRPSRRPLTVAQLFARLNDFLRKDTVVVADVGDALFGAADLSIYRGMEFLSPAYYTSLGFAVPGAIGAQLAKPSRRPLVLVGDGAFQMTGLELATAARYGLNPIVVVLNNQGYGTERPMQDGPYNDVARMIYHRLPGFLGSGKGWLAETEEELLQALAEAEAHTESYCLVEAMLDSHDCSPALRRLTARLARRI